MQRAESERCVGGCFRERDYAKAQWQCLTSAPLPHRGNGWVTTSGALSLGTDAGECPFFSRCPRHCRCLVACFCPGAVRSLRGGLSGSDGGRHAGCPISRALLTKGTRDVVVPLATRGARGGCLLAWASARRSHFPSWEGTDRVSLRARGRGSLDALPLLLQWLIWGSQQPESVRLNAG